MKDKKATHKFFWFFTLLIEFIDNVICIPSETASRRFIIVFILSCSPFWWCLIILWWIFYKFVFCRHNLFIFWLISLIIFCKLINFFISFLPNIRLKYCGLSLLNCYFSFKVYSRFFKNFWIFCTLYLSIFCQDGLLIIGK